MALHSIKNSLIRVKSKGEFEYDGNLTVNYKDLIKLNKQLNKVYLKEKEGKSVKKSHFALGIRQIKVIEREDPNKTIKSLFFCCVVRRNSKKPQERYEHAYLREGDLIACFCPIVLDTVGGKDPIDLEEKFEII